MNNDISSDRVVQALRARIAELSPGARLPSARELVARLRVSPLTVRAAVARLVAEGAIEARPGSGTFVAPGRRPVQARGDDFGWQSVSLGTARADMRAVEQLLALPPQGAICLSTGYLPPDLQASADLARCLARAATRPGAWDRVPLEGIEPLRAWFAQQIGGAFTARDVLVCPGGKPAIAAAFRGLAAPGDAIVMESPTYIGAIATARASGLRIVPVASDAEGVRPDLLADALATSGARVFYCQPTHANPTGTVWSAIRRRQVLEVIRATRAFLIEDDWARDLHFGAQPLAPPLAALDPDGHVVHIRSLTKSAAPGLRVGALCARGAAFARLRGARSADDFYVAGPLQEAALQFVTSPAWPRHLRRMHLMVRERRDALVDALRSGLGDRVLTLVPDGGFHLWTRLPDGVDEAEAARHCARDGLVVSAGCDWFPGDPDGSYLRLTFAGAPPDRLARGAAILARIVGRSSAQ
ncbi:MAG TPA: PLP-dependent aminotransferase family protein [Aliidongia sp.]|uniref:aminotransferase-like domain-containing protein n=1 Tax=Aliidongia sp. TaxID=1914230 RepID=UPI002DDCAB8D|nr:PLP-dependent aminotransferase family protein [Aliidongia sp.]HEV2675208.1 PLP-dependent aminotransferase family protein [Aliidongia sp.]